MKLGFVSMPLTGHLNPMLALARKLQSRGQDVAVIGILDIEPAVRVAGLEFVPYCEADYPSGSLAAVLGPAASMRGLALDEFAYRHLIPGLNEAAFKHLPNALAAAGIDALVLDTIHSFIELVPMQLGLPYIQVWNVVPVDTSGLTPPCYFSWPYEPTEAALARNLQGWKTIQSFLPPLWAVAKSYAAEQGLHVDWNDPYATFSKLAVIAQLPREFDFPENSWPAHFHYTGPLEDNAGREPIPFPWDRLRGKPLVYASLGTLVNGLEAIYRTILEAAAALTEMDFAISVGANLKMEDLQPIPPNAVVVGSAPQIDLLRRARTCITHAGLNTTLEALALGVPLIAIPLGFDQPGVAARIAYHGVGEFIEAEHLDSRTLLELIRKVSDDPKYRSKAARLQTAITHNRGLDTAADIIQQAFLT